MRHLAEKAPGLLIDDGACPSAAAAVPSRDYIGISTVTALCAIEVFLPLLKNFPFITRRVQGPSAAPVLACEARGVVTASGSARCC